MITQLTRSAHATWPIQCSQSAWHPCFKVPRCSSVCPKLHSRDVRIPLCVPGKFQSIACAAAVQPDIAADMDTYTSLWWPLLLSLLAGMSTSIGGLIAVTLSPDEGTLAFLLGTGERLKQSTLTCSQPAGLSIDAPSSDTFSIKQLPLLLSTVVQQWQCAVRPSCSCSFVHVALFARPPACTVVLTVLPDLSSPLCR